MASSSFGIDFGERYIRVVDAQYNNNKFELNTIGEEQSLSNFFSDDTEKTIEMEAGWGVRFQRGRGRRGDQDGVGRV